MATVRPFRALRPRPELAARICELPYDVMSSDEAREIARGNPLSFLRVSKPEIDLPPETDPYSPEVYAKGRENFQRLIRDGALIQDARPNFYLYRQVMGHHAQTGLVAVASCEEYLQGVIKKHELTRVDKEEDRVRHIEALDSQTGPVFLTYKAQADLDARFAEMIQARPAIDFVAADQIRHSAWTISDPETQVFIQERFAGIPFLYIADGHHRCAAAARVFKARGGAVESGYFLAVIFPHDQLRILAYNRVLTDLGGNTARTLLEKLKAIFEIRSPGAPTPSRKHELGLYLEGQWHSLEFRPALTAGSDPLETLDVALLQKHVLGPVFGIDDPRTSKRIHFVGGIRGTDELEKLVRSGDYACAFSMFPTSIVDLMRIADAGGIMPPKSTWFEPKLRDAMFCHMI